MTQSNRVIPVWVFLVLVATIAIGSGVPPAVTVRETPVDGVTPAPGVAGDIPVRLTPVRVRFTGAASAGDPFAVIDRDTRTTFSASGGFTLIFDMEQPQTVAGLRVFGRPDATLSVSCANGESWVAVPGLQGVRASLLAPGWSDLTAAMPCATSAVRVDVTSAASATTVPEIEIWGAGTPVVPASPQTLRVISEPSLPWALRSFDAALAETTVEGSGVTAHIEIPRAVSQLRRAYLLYDLKGLATWRGVPRRVNGRPTQGGALETPSLDWTQQIERINPEWLREGENEVAFLPSETATPYEVRDVRLLVELDTGTNSVELATTPESPDMSRGVSPAVDGELATPWTPFPTGASAGTRSTLTLSLDRTVEPVSLGIVLKSVPSGSIQVQAIDDLGAVRTLAARDGAELRAGWNVIPLDPGASASQLRIVLEAGAAGGWEPLEIVPLGSGVGGRAEPPSLTIVWPYQGEFAGREAVIRGFVTPDPTGLPVRVTIGPVVVETVDGAFGATVSKDDVGLFDDPDETPWTVGVQALYPSGRTLTRTVRLTRATEGPHSIDGQLLGARSFSVSPGQARKIRHDGAGLDLEAGSVDRPKDLKITPLSDDDLPALDTGMTNVTKGPRRGYRFEPHGSHFAKPLRVTLPYDPSLLPEGMTGDEVQTFYFDDQAGRWVALDRVTVDAAAKSVVSLTDHFTDMINATLSLPEHPELLSNEPTMLEKVPAADPAERVVLIDPPKASNLGEAQMTYPLDVPPGRAKMTPELRINYASNAGNGWLGVGWTLPLSSVSIDTRWGVPRFDGALESETYTLNGDQLTPLAHRQALEPRTSEKAFHFRREGRFARIVRHGDGPGNYWWETTDKDGTVSIFGGGIDSILADDQGRITRWLLREKHDLHGNGIAFDYHRVDDVGLANGTVPGRQLYLQTIRYTTSGADAGAFTIRMIRDADLGEPRRPDVMIDARGGFKEVTSQLLRRIVVELGGATVRSWDLAYRRGAFEKTLLESITQRGADGSVLATHRFAYFDDVREGSAYTGFSPTETWSTGADGVRSAPVDEIASQFGSDAGRATALSAFATTHVGGHLYVGFNPDAPTKPGSAGGKVGFNGTVSSEGLLALADMNGDHLPDKVFKNSSGVFLRLNRSGPRGTTEFGPAIAVSTLPAISAESAATVSFGAESYFGVTAIANEATGITTGLTYIADVNGDGLSDLVEGGTVLFNHLDENGIPTFDPDSATSPAPVGPAAVDTASLLPDLGAQLGRVRENAPLQDTLRRWVAPYPGHVRIGGDASLTASGAPGVLDDGVRIAIQHNGSELWSQEIAAGDATAYTPSGVDSVEVARGDRLYFRVQSRDEGSHDVVSWDPEIAYVGAPSAADANGLNPYRFHASEDFVLAGRPGVLVKAPFTGRVRLTGDLVKTGVTTDAVVLLVLKNGQQAYADVLQADETGSMPLGISFDVAQDDTLQLRVKVDSPIDLRKIEWTPSMFYVAPPDGPAPTHTIDGNTVTIERVVDDAGHPLIQLHPPYHIDMYPEDGLSAPQSPWVADDDETVTVSSHLVAAPTATGVVFMTAKRRGELIAKRTIFITNGNVQNRSVDIDVEDGDEIFFDYSCLDPDLAPLVGHRVIEVDGDSVPSAFHTSARQGVFPLAYRGWTVAGYNGNPPRDAGAISESDLDVTYDEDSVVDPRTDKAYLYTPFPEGGVWRGPEEETFVAAGGAGSSRLGPNSIPSPAAPGSAVRAPFRMSSSLQVAGELGVGLLSGSTSVGDGGSDVDFLDMNGDQFPDVVGRSRIQYSPALGGLEAASRGIAGFDAPRATDSTAGNVGVGGSPASFSVGARGQVDTPGRGGAPKENTTGSQMVQLGLSGGLGTGTSSVPFDLVDINGDGLPDQLTRSDDGVLSVAFNLGYGFAPSEPWGVGALNEGSSDSASIGTNLGFNGGVYDYAGGVSLSRNASETSSMLADINGDGLPDRISRSGNAIMVGINTGAGFLADTPWGGAPQGAFATTRDTSVGGGAYFTVGVGPVCLFECWIILNPGVDTSTSLARQETALMDVDGDGYPDHVASHDEATMTVARNTTGRTNLLRSISRPLGARIDIDYERDGNTSNFPQSRWDLARVALFDGLPGDGADVQLATFKYDEGTWDRLEREFYGYGEVVEQVRDSSHGEALVRTITRDFAVDSYYTKGLLLRERLEDALGRPFTETEHTYEVKDVATQAPLADLKSTTATGFPGLVRTDRRFFEGQAAPGKTTYSTQEFDALGNVIHTVDIGDDGAEDDLEATLEYSSCAATHVVGTPVAITVKGNGAELRRRGGTVDCATGDVTRITEYLADGTGAETVLAYDGYGNLTRLTGPPNRNGQRYEMLYEYDPVVHTHTTQVTDSFGYVSTTMYDVALGRKTATRDVDGNRTAYTYDTHGRLTSVRGPYEQTGANPTVRFEYHPDAAVPWSLTRHLDTYRNASDPIDVARFIDGLKRVVQEKSDASVFTSAAGSATDVMTISGRVLFDAVGRVTDRFHPLVEPLGTPGVFRATFDTVSPTHTTYDTLDRPLSLTLPDATTSTTAYGFGTTREGTTQLVARTTDANGSVSAAYRNVRNLLAASEEKLGAQSIWTSYAYDALDRMRRITDDHGNVTRIDFDNLGRKTVVDSPDEGRTEDAYDLAGNRIARVTANLRSRSHQITYDYDFKRLSRVVYPEFPGNSISYSYGAPGAAGNRAGRVFRIVDQSGTRERTFGKLGETVSETRTIASTIPSGVQTYVTGYTLDSFDRLQQLVYPDGETLTLRYDSGGRLRNITGHKGAFDYEYLRRMEYDKFGAQAFVEEGNGTRATYAYRPDNRRLASVLSARPDGRPFVDMSYAYDAVGNVLSRTNTVPIATGSDFGGPTIQTFTYDDLDRMTSSHGAYQYAPNKLDRYTVMFDYDTIYNMTARSQLHEIVQPSGSTVRQGKTSYAFAYAYGGPQPHAATHIGERTFAYDANGNQAGWQDDRNGTRRNIVWDEENRMQNLFDNGHEIRFLYDDQGDRVIKRGPQGETVYVNPWLTVRNGTIGTKHVWAGTMRVASKLMKANALEKDRFFYHPDHSGTTNFVTDAAGNLYEHLEYFPFGETWVQESSNTQRTPYTFTGKELDEETGLLYFGARYLDPRLGSFNAGEPLLVGSPEKGRDDPRFLSVYSYAHQNPERYADPDGKDVIILVGQPGDQQWWDNRQVKAGFPAAARALQKELRSKGITAHIVDLGAYGSKKPSATAALSGAASKLKKVEAVVYVGHGDPKTHDMTPAENGPNVSVKAMVDAAGIAKGGAFVAYGCEVSVGLSADALKERGISVHTTLRQWTYTKQDGTGALGTGERGGEQTPYGNIWNLRLFNITTGVDVNNGAIPIGETNKTMLEGLVDAHNATK